MASSDDRKEDLNSILTKEECIALTLLIANIEEVMRKQISDVFDASIVKGKLPALESANTNSSVNENQTRSPEETEEEEKARKLQEKREKELSAPKMLDLKKDCVAFFDSWRESIDSRVGAVINSPRDVVEKQKEEASVEATPTTKESAERKVLREHPHMLTSAFQTLQWKPSKGVKLTLYARTKYKHRRG